MIKNILISFQVELFWKHCEEKNPRDKHGATPMINAIWYNNLDVVKFFINNGINLEDNDYRLTPLQVAVLNSDVEMVKFVFSNSVNKNDIIKDDPFKDTFLHTAARRGNLDVFKFLYNKTCEKNPKNLLGESPLDVAISGNNVEIFDFLANSGNYNFDKVDKDGRTILHYIARKIRYRPINEIVKLILNNVQNKEPIDFDGNSPLHYAAAEKGRLDFFKLFWNEATFSKTAKNYYNYTPLDLAYRNEVRNFIREELGLD